MPKKGFTKTNLDEMDLWRLYIDSRLSHAQIADNVGCSRTCIQRLCKKYGILSRTNAESQTAMNETRSPIFTEQQEQLIYGSLLGDACLGRSVMKSNKTDRKMEIYKLIFFHTEKYIQYVEHKCDILGTGVKTKKRCKLSTRISGHGSTMRGFSFSHTPTLKLIAKYCLDNNYKKKITKQWLDKIKWHGLAYWFMDDGCLCLNRRDLRAFINFYTQSFNEEEINLLIHLLRRFGIHAIKGKDPNGSFARYIIQINYKKDVWRFLEKTEQYIVPCMRYKNRILRNNWETIDEYHRMQQ
jgi:hypothetical protein